MTCIAVQGADEDDGLPGTGPASDYQVSREAMVNESPAVLNKVLVPALQAVGSTSAVAKQATASTQQMLLQLEKQMPGASSQLLQELLVKLSAAPDAQLRGSKTVASTLLGAAGDVGSGAVEQRPGKAAAPSRAVPGLGPLGEFLLGKWQEEVAHEKALLARLKSMGV